jgi:hypothetical protein
LDADGVEIDDWDALGASMSELSEFDRAGIAKIARNKVLMTAIRPHCFGFTFAPFCSF